nr:sigma factor-like helix-turn-helix DNA-binding protein [Variovorax boronicumulans]
MELREHFLRRNRVTFKELWPLPTGISLPRGEASKLNSQDQLMLARLLEQATAPLEALTLEQVKGCLRQPLERVLGFLARVEALEWEVPPPVGCPPLAEELPATTTWLDAKLRDRAIALLELPWVASASAQDVRLQALDLRASPNDWLSARLDHREVPSTFRVLVELLEQFDKMTASQEARAVVDALAWHCTPNRAPLATKARWKQMFLQRVLSESGNGRTLKEVGDAFGVTRERIRQICERFELACQGSAICTPALDRVVAAAARVVPMEVVYADEQLARFIGEGAGLESLLGWAALVGRSYPVHCVRVRTNLRGVSGELAVLQKVGEAPWVASMVRHIRRDQQMLGCTNVLRVAGLLALRDEVCPGMEALETILQASTEFRWLDKETGWFTWGDSSRCAAASRVRKVVAVAHDTVGVDEIVGALASDDVWLYREDKSLGLAVPPVHVFRELCKSWPWVQVTQRARLALKPEADPGEGLSPTERVAVNVIAAQDGVACRFEISDAVHEQHGFSGVLVSTTLGSSPVFERIEHGLYAVRGRRMGDHALADARERAAARAGRAFIALGDALASTEFALRVTEASLRNEQYTVPARFGNQLNGNSFAVRSRTGAPLGTAWVTGRGVLKGLNRLFPQARAGELYRVQFSENGSLRVSLSPSSATDENQTASCDPAP